MSKDRHVVFFGASVTEQDTHHVSGMLSGFVTYFQTHLAAGWQVSRVSAGSSNIADAAIIYVEKVIALAPQVCVLDWVTPALQTCDPRLVQQVYYRLLQHGILPVTVFFPRRDRLQRDIPIARAMAAICAEFDLPLYDAQALIEQHGVDVVLRDVVHTTAEGARIYAEAIAVLLQDLGQADRNFGPAARFTPAPFQVIELTAETPVPSEFTRLTLSNRGPAAAELEFALVMEQRVGPYSPILDIQVKTGGSSTGADSLADNRDLPPFPIWDAWCYRERQCIKAITSWYQGPLSQLELRVSRRDPPYAQIPQAVPIPLAERCLKQRGGLYLILRSGDDCALSYRCDNEPVLSEPVLSEPNFSSPLPLLAPPVLKADSPATRPAVQMDCILHIGIGKAGSATVQGALEAAREQLYAARVLYPEDLMSDGSTGGDNQKCLAVAAMERNDNVVLKHHRVISPLQRLAFNKRVQAHYSQIVAAAGDRVCLLSAEHFWSCLTQPDEITRLAEQLQVIGLRVRRIVVYLRRQSDWLESIQHQRLREAKELLPMRSAQLTVGHMARQLDYAAVLAKWQAGFPAAQICPRLFEKSAFVAGDLLTDFIDATGLDPELLKLLPKPDDTDVSGLSNAGINALLHVNRAFPVVLADGKWNHARRNVAAFISARMSGDCALLPQHERQAIDAFYHDSNEALRKIWFPQRDSLFQTDYSTHTREQFTPSQNKEFFAALDLFSQAWRLETVS